MITKELSEFYKHATGKNGLVAICKDCCKEKQAKYLLKNKKSRYEYNKKYYEENKALVLKKCKEYRDSNKEKERKYRREYIRKKLKSDEVFSRGHRLRSLLRIHLKKRGLKKASSTRKIIGCSFDVLNSHLVSTAIKNYGEYSASENYHIDHIIPLATAKTIEDVEKLFHFTNLQLLKATDNIKKSDSMTWTIKTSGG